ncbi:MAG: exosortase C-terminal domain/associated protein EpsI [Planctomycetia bacterium]
MNMLRTTMTPFTARLTAAALLVSLGWVGQHWFESRVAAMNAERPRDLLRPLADFPRTIGEWTSVDVEIDHEIKAAIGGDEYLKRLYTHSNGEQCVLWMSFSRSSLDQKHFPTICMRGAGWTELESSRRTVPVETSAHAAEEPTVDERETPAAVQRLQFSRGENRMIVHYWYYLIGENSFDETMRYMGRWARGFVRGRHNASLTLEVFSQTKKPDAGLLDEFAKSAAGALKQWVPSGTKTACDLGSAD